MAELHSLVFTKKIGGAVFDSAAHGVVCLEDMPIMSFEAKDPYENDWPDENGVEVYNKEDSKAFFKAQDITFLMGTKGDNCLRLYTDFVNYLTTGGLLMSVHSEFSGMTIPSVRFVKADPDGFYSSNSEKVFTFKLTLKITNYQ